MKNKKLENLEKKLNIASDLLEELDFVDNDDEELSLPTPVDPSLPAESKEIEEVFNISSLKQDFVLIRNNVIKLIASGQRILDSASLIEVSDMKASQLMALASLQTSLGNNLKMMVDTYKAVAEIEKMKNAEASKYSTEVGSNVNMGSVTTNNIVFNGSSSQLLEILKQQQDT